MESPPPDATAPPVGRLPAVTLVIMAHRSRIDRALVLKAEVGAQSVVPDPAPDDEPNALRCARSAWGVAARAGEWAAVMQDDAIPCPGFHAGVVEQVWRDAQQATDQPCAVAFYYGSQSRTGYRMRQPYAEMFAGRPEGEYLATVCAVVPTLWVRPWIAWSRSPAWVDSIRDDECWGAFLDFYGYPALATIPCLVDHDNTLPSVAGNHTHGARYAAVPPPREVPRWFTAR